MDVAPALTREQLDAAVIALFGKVCGAPIMAVDIDARYPPDAIP